jgi:predicted amidohydrolase YtcJ
MLAGLQPPGVVVYYNGHFVTMSDAHPTAEAVAIRGNSFLAVGTLADVRFAAGSSARQIDLHGRTVLPGLEDSHTHPITAALSEQDGPIPVIGSIADVQAYIRKQAATTPADRLIFLPEDLFDAALRPSLSDSPGTRRGRAESRRHDR